MISSVGPLPESLDDPNKFTGEPEGRDGEPIDIGTRLQTVELCRRLINREMTKVAIRSKPLTKSFTCIGLLSGLKLSL